MSTSNRQLRCSARARIAVALAAGAIAATASGFAAATTEPPPTAPAGSEPDGSVPATIPRGTIVPTDLTDEETLIAERAIAASALIRDVGFDPELPDWLERAEDLLYFGGSVTETVFANVAYLQEHGLAIRPHPDPELQSSLIVEEVAITSPGDRAEVTVCTVDTDILYEPGGAPDGSDAIVNDDVGARWNLYTMLFRDGRWLLWWNQNLSEFFTGVTDCEEIPR